MIEAPVKEPRDLQGPVGVRVEDASRTFVSKRGEVRALEHMSLRAQRGEIVAVVGPSGCGKTTLLELICGLQAPDAGTVRCEPAVLMPQRDLLLPWLSALDNAALALRARGVARAEARSTAAPWFERFGLEGFERARPSELSGGMRQRVSFLRSLLAGKPVLALDEPFASLDAITRAEMQGWLAHALELESRTVVLVTHDVEEAVVLGRPRGRDVAPAGPGGGRARGRAPAAPRGHRPVGGRDRARRRSRRWGWRDEALLAGWRPLVLLLRAARAVGAVRAARRRRPADPAASASDREVDLHRPLAAVVELPDHGRGGAARHPPRRGRRDPAGDRDPLLRHAAARACIRCSSPRRRSRSR